MAGRNAAALERMPELKAEQPILGRPPDLGVLLPVSGLVDNHMA
jgi:hypothetical protein